MTHRPHLDANGNEVGAERRTVIPAGRQIRKQSSIWVQLPAEEARLVAAVMERQGYTTAAEEIRTQLGFLPG